MQLQLALRSGSWRHWCYTLRDTCCGDTLRSAPTYGALHFSKTVLTLGDGGVSAEPSQNCVNIPSGPRKGPLWISLRHGALRPKRRTEPGIVSGLRAVASVTIPKEREDVDANNRVSTVFVWMNSKENRGLWQASVSTLQTFLSCHRPSATQQPRWRRWSGKRSGPDAYSAVLTEGQIHHLQS